MPPSMALYTPHKQRALLASQKVDRKSLAQELRYLGDPAKLADRTVSLLKQDDRIKAVELVKMASLSFPCTVSWNHIMDHDMKQGRIKFAIKTFNEVKKFTFPPLYRSSLVKKIMQKHMPTMFPDEEAWSATRCPYVYHPFSWFGHIRWVSGFSAAGDGSV